MNSPAHLRLLRFVFLCAAAEICACGTDDEGGAANPRDSGAADASVTDVQVPDTAQPLTCGSALATLCEAGERCVADNDCASNNCWSGTCRVPSATNGKRDGDETDVDCGGSASRCAPGKACGGPIDCLSNVCNLHVYSAPTAMDAVKNGSETDVDCGGGEAPACKEGGACGGAADCASADCWNGHCATPTTNDGRKNGTESDIDCGGSSGVSCAAGKVCVAGSDCASNGCRGGVCAIRESCKFVHGGGTCGKGEFGDPAAAHEDCCMATEVPRPAANGGPFTLDKYRITAGRMRAFLEAVNYDVRGYVTAHKPAGWLTAWNPSVPASYGEAMNHLGAGNFPATRWGNDASAGCFAGAGGGSTFWESPQDQATYSGDVPRPYTQESLDEKALNCVTPALLVAFCAWDGGRLMSLPEWRYAVRKGVAISDASKPTNFFPWNLNNAVTSADAVKIWNFANYPSAGTEFSSANWVPNYEQPRAQVPVGGSLRDMAAFVAAPGRFPAGVGPFGHQDLIGLLESAGFDSTGKLGFWFQYSWQERGYQMFGNLALNRLETFYENYNWKHAAIGGRCAR